ncbi:MAG TPA: AmmeMemoRadiSam system protein B [Sedimentisphaerales bacterium]|nr:AmmeMemoRadiSam system protein B [Sedimentisphaerales bacterium]
MQTRKPIVAGQFYPGRHDSCVAEINECLEAGTLSESLPDTIVAGIVPHAGWTFSGSVAALVFSAIKQQHEEVHTFVIFGAAHGYFGQLPAVYEAGTWLTPLGEVAIDEELASAVLSSGAAVSDYMAHRAEHSIEVQLPFIQHLFVGTKILPILVPPTEQAVALGAGVGDVINRDERKKVVCIGSTDLTHYGPRYGFTPMGTGAEALQWASRVNDRQFIDLVLKLEPQRILANAAENYNACGAGAAAAAVAVAKKLGKTEGLLLAHTNSNEVMLRRMGTTSADSVGYAAIIF